MKRTSRVLSGTLASGRQMMVGIALQIVLMPRILATAGPATAGAYAILMQMVGYLALADLGVSTALGRSLSQAAQDRRRFDELLSGGLVMLLGLGLVYALLAVGLAFAQQPLFHFPEPLAQEARNAMLLLGAWGLIRFPLSVFPTALVASQDLTWPPVVGLAANVLRMVFALYAVGAGWGLVGLSAANILAEVILAVVLTGRFLRRQRAWSFTRRGLAWPSLKPQIDFGLRAFWGNLAGRVILSSDNLVVGGLYGPAVTSVYYNTQTPVSMGYNLLFRLADNAAPGINELWSQGAWQTLRDVFLRLQRLTLLLAAPVVIGGWFYLGRVVTIWVGARQYGGPWLTLWLVLFAGLVTVGYVPQVFVYAGGDIRRFSQLIALEAVANLALSILLGAWLGLPGVALATTLTHIPMVFYVQRRVHRDLGIGWREWANRALRPAVLASAPTLIAAALLSRLAPPQSWLGLAAHGGALGLVHLLSSYAFGLAGPDRAAIAALLKRRPASPTETRP